MASTVLPPRPDAKWQCRLRPMSSAVRRLLRVLAMATTLAPVSVAAGEVIAHPSVDISAAEVRDVFLGERQWSGDLKLVPVDNLAAHDHFLARVLQTDSPKYAARWLRKSFREGLAAPPMKGSDSEVIEFVKATRGAIGYLSSPSTAGVKVLGRF